MELKITVKTSDLSSLKEIVKEVSEIAKEHGCNRTLLEIETSYLFDVECPLLDKK